jgi:hypothetical protein
VSRKDPKPVVDFILSHQLLGDLPADTTPSSKTGVK